MKDKLHSEFYRELFVELLRGINGELDWGFYNEIYGEFYDTRIELC